MVNNVVAYIDLLAFSNHLRENTSDALMAMNNYNTILSSKIRDTRINPVLSYPEELRELAKIHSIDSFDFFLPFSDSVFLMSSDCSSFIKQLGSFVLQSFTLTAHFYRDPIDSSKPEKGHIINYSIAKDGNVVVNEGECNYYPALFRGGLAYGESFPIELSSVVDRNLEKTKVITGKAVVNAVRLESSVKGPRLVFCQDVFEQLNSDAQDYCRTIPESNNMYEILWPALKYIKQNDVRQCEQEIQNMYETIVPAYNLWKAYNHTPFSAHYYNLIELIIASTIKFFDRKCNLKNYAKNKIFDWINNNELKDKIDINRY